MIRNVDLVVTPDTAIAHLAGALGRRFGWHSRCRPIGFGSKGATTRRGIRRCDSFAKPGSTSGRTFLTALLQRRGTPRGNSEACLAGPATNA